MSGALAVLDAEIARAGGEAFQAGRDLIEARANFVELIENNAEGKRQWDRVAKALAADPDCVDDVFQKAEAVAGLIAAGRQVQMIPSPVGSGYRDGTPEDRAYRIGFNYALRLVRGPNFACGLDAALAHFQGGGA